MENVENNTVKVETEQAAAPAQQAAAPKTEKPNGRNAPSVRSVRLKKAEERFAAFA